MSQRLDDLSSAMKPKAFELLARLTERGIMCMVVDTLRTAEEHAQNVKNGTSKTALSRHLPRRLRMYLHDSHPDFEKSDAMDICPFSVWQLNGPDKLQWDAADPAWVVIRDLAEGLGLVSGSRWKDPHDPGHVELPREVWMR